MPADVIPLDVSCFSLDVIQAGISKRLGFRVRRGIGLRVACRDDLGRRSCLSTAGDLVSFAPLAPCGGLWA